MNQRNQVAYRLMGSIGGRLLIAFVSIVLLTAIVISGVSAVSGLRNGEQQVINQLESVATLKEGEIETWLNRLKTDLPAMLVGADAFRRTTILLQASPAAENYQDAHDELQGRFRQAMEQMQLFEEVFLMDLQGRVVLSTETAQEGKTLSSQIYFQQGLKRSYVHPPSYSLLLGRMAVFAAQPVVDQQGHTMGVLVGHASMATLNEIMLARAGLGETGRTYLVGANHASLSGLDPAIQEKRVGVYVHTEGATAAIKDQVDGSGRYDNDQGTPVIGVYRWLPELQVALLAEQDQSEAFEVAYTTLGVNLSVAFFSVLLAWVASFFVTRTIANPLAELSRTAARIASGNRDTRAPVRRHDEVGLLSTTFNQMVESIQQTETALRESETKFRYIFDSDIIGIAYCDLQGNITDANDAFLKMVGYTKEDVEARKVNWQDMTPPEYSELEEKASQEIIQRGVITPYEKEYLRQDASRVPVIFGAARLEEYKGMGVGFVLDITERKRTEEELRRYREHLEELVKARTAELQRTNDELAREITERVQAEEALREAKEAADAARIEAEAANRAKSAFLANMSHELRTPLNAILGFTQLMRRDLTFTPTQQENLRIIRQSGEHLLELINDVLEMSKIEAGYIALEANDFDLYQLLATIESMFGVRAYNKNLELGIECASDVPQYIYTDERKLRQVLINLLNNAIKFTEVGGVTLRVRCLNDLPLQRTKSEPLPIHRPLSLVFEIEDTGAGIAPHEMDKLFEAFTQTASGQERLEGTGLGLPLSQRFVQLMGGEIVVESPPSSALPHVESPPSVSLHVGGEEIRRGPGSVFRFDIQVLMSEADAVSVRHLDRRIASLAPGQRAPDGDPYRILVVEDREASRALLVQLLTAVGFEVREATNGQQAIAAWQTWQPHLIWMDMRMPIMDGYQATQHIKSQMPNPQSPMPIIIALTAHAFEEERAAILAAGCDDFVRKPFQEEEIFEVMAQHLGVRYVYEDLAQPAKPGDQAAQVALTSADLAALPTDWVANLQQAATQGEAELVFDLIDQIKLEHAPLAKSLVQWVHEFRFDKIVALTEPRTG